MAPTCTSPLICPPRPRRHLPDLDGPPGAWEEVVGARPDEEPQFVLLADPFSSDPVTLLAGLESDEMKMTLARQTITNEWSVRQLENAVALMRKSTPTLPKTPQKVHSLPAELTELETFCRETFGVRATITGNQKKGKITLQYYSAEELEQVYELLHQLHHD